MALQLVHITKYYRYGKNKQLVINDLSIKFPRTGMIAIIGKSGSGKSTLLNLIAGIEKANSGKVVIDGRELNYRQINEYQNNYISYVYQFYNLIPALTVRENLLFLSGVKGKKVSLKHLHSLTDKLAITPLLDKFPSELSGGQKQRIGLIRAFICNCPILLADEPTGALNREMADEVMRLLKQYAKKHLVIIISHNHELVRKFTNFVIDLDSNQNNYNFDQVISYHKYITQSFDNQTVKIKYYLKRQLGYQKKKILMMLCSQIFTISAFVLLLSGINGGWLYLQSCLQSDPLKEIVEISKKDYYAMNFTDQQLTEFKNDQVISQLDYKLNLSLGILKAVDQEISLNSYQVYESNYFEYLKGHFPRQNNQVIINLETAQQYHLKLNDKLIFMINDEEYYFTISAIINDYINSGTNIYLNSEYIDSKLQDKIVDKSTLIAKCSAFKKLFKKYDKDYLLISFHQDYLDNYQILFDMALIVVISFLGISFIIALILISIVLKTILIERKRDICLMLSNGLSINKAKKLFGQESCLIGGVIGILGSVIAEVLLLIVKLLNVSEKFLNIPNLFILPKFFLSRYDLYLIIILVYMFACFMVGSMASIKIGKMDASILLKED